MFQMCELEDLNQRLINMGIKEYDNKTGKLEWNEDFNPEIEQKRIDEEYED